MRALRTAARRTACGSRPAPPGLARAPTQRALREPTRPRRGSRRSPAFVLPQATEHVHVRVVVVEPAIRDERALVFESRAFERAPRSDVHVEHVGIDAVKIESRESV